MTALQSGKIPAESLQASRWLDRGITLAVVLACATALSLNLADPDLWGHIQYGRDALQNGLSATTTYSYVAEGYAWVNHEILAELGLAIVNDHFGGPGLLLMKVLAGVAVVLLVRRQSLQQHAGLVASCAIMLLVAACLGRHWSLRPQLVSYVSFALLLSLLSWCFRGWEGEWQLRLSGSKSAAAELSYDSGRMRSLWLVPILMMVWTNSHGGFLAGLCVYIAYLGLRGIEVVSQRGWDAWGLLKRFALMATAAVAATFINPYGPGFHVWLWHDLKVPRPEILEWRAPDFADPQTLPFVVMGCLWLACLTLSRRRQDWTQNVILALILWQAVTHHRHMAFFAIAAGFWLPGHLQSLLERFGAGAPDTSLGSTLSPRARVAFAGALLAAIALCGVQLGARVSQLQVDRQTYPVAAFDYIAERGLTGRMVVTFNWAQYALAAFGPQQAGQPGLLVHVDGRCRTSYSQAMLDEHFDFILGRFDPEQRYRDPASGAFEPGRILASGEPDLVLIARAQQPSVEVMQSQGPAWALLYQDDLAQVWGRATRFDDPTSSSYLSPAERSIGSAPQTGYAAWPALPVYRYRVGVSHGQRVLAAK